MLNNYKYGFRAIGNYVVPTYVTKNCVSLIRLAVESTIAMYGPSKDAAPKKSDREKRKAEQQQKLLSDIKTLNSRFVKRDAIKEHEEKMKEFADFMSDIQDYLLEPVNSNEERDFKDDIQGPLLKTHFALKG